MTLEYLDIMGLLMYLMCLASQPIKYRIPIFARKKLFTWFKDGPIVRYIKHQKIREKIKVWNWRRTVMTFNQRSSLTHP